MFDSQTSETFGLCYRKILAPKKIIVPIVLDRKIVENAIGSENHQVFVAARDFKGPKELGEHLKTLMADLEVYKK